MLSAYAVVRTPLKLSSQSCDDNSESHHLFDRIPISRYGLFTTPWHKACSHVTFGTWILQPILFKFPTNGGWNRFPLEQRLMHLSVCPNFIIGGNFDETTTWWHINIDKIGRFVSVRYGPQYRIIGPPDFPFWAKVSSSGSPWRPSSTGLSATH